MPSPRRTLSAVLCMARKERGLSQQQLAAKLGMRQSQISELEHGKNDIRLSTLTDVARVLDLEPMLIPRRLLPAVEGLLAGQGLESERPLYALGGDVVEDEDDSARKSPVE